MLLPGLLACERAPASEICPRIEPGDLVISELRDLQAGNDTVDTYIELHNASGRTLDLQGVRVRQIATNGATHELLIRDSLLVEEGGYAVIGPGLERTKAWVDYAVGWDIPGGDPSPAEGGDPVWPTDVIRFGSGYFELEACDELIDVVFVELGALPSMGTLACGNADSRPDATANDRAPGGCWCVDAEPAEADFHYPGIGLPGTPGSANRCP